MDRSQLKQIPDFIWNIADDRLRDVYVLALLSAHAELLKQFSDNPSFNRWLTDSVFDATYRFPPPKPAADSGGAARA